MKLAYAFYLCMYIDIDIDTDIHILIYHVAFITIIVNFYLTSTVCPESC